MNATALRVFIVDDEPPARNRLRELLADCNEQLPVVVVGEAANGQQTLDKLTDTPADVVLLDIRMPQMDGIELAQHFHKLPHAPAVIFTTAYDSYAIKAFELHAIDYLLKPIRLSRLLDALGRARAPLQIELLRELQPEPRRHLCIHERGRIHLIPIGEVLFMRAELKYITVRTAGYEYLLEESLSAMEKEFAARFVRIHRNCLVAREAIAGFERGSEEGESSGWMVRLKELPEMLAISRRQQHIVKEFS